MIYQAVYETKMRNDRVLECACGTGLITVAVAGKCGKLVATDYSEGMLKQTRNVRRALGMVDQISMFDEDQEEITE